MSEHKSIAAALAKAQLSMGKALKKANNPHFRKSYADLGNVMDACLEPLNENGIALIQPTGTDEIGPYVKTILIHGESGETLESTVHLILGKKDMQGYGSAVTYARRYGLMAMAGIAPEDDDGNAAAGSGQATETPRKQEKKPEPTGAELRDNLKAWMNAPKTTPEDVRNAWQSNDNFKAKLASLPQPMQLELKAEAEKICPDLKEAA